MAGCGSCGPGVKPTAFSLASKLEFFRPKFFRLLCGSLATEFWTPTEAAISWLVHQPNASLVTTEPAGAEATSQNDSNLTHSWHSKSRDYPLLCTVESWIFIEDFSWRRRLLHLCGNEDCRGMPFPCTLNVVRACKSNGQWSYRSTNHHSVNTNSGEF